MNGKTLEEIEVSDHYESDTESDSLKINYCKTSNSHSMLLTDNLERDLPLEFSPVRKKGMYSEIIKLSEHYFYTIPSYSVMGNNEIKTKKIVLFDFSEFS